MNATVATKDLNRALSLVGRCISKKASLPALSCVHIQTGIGCLLVSASDLERNVTVRVPAEHVKQGSFVCSRDRLSMGFAEKSETVTLALKESILHILSNGGLDKSATLSTLPNEEFPVMMTHGEGDIPLFADRFGSFIQRALPFIYDDSGNMAGVYLNNHTSEIVRVVGISRKCVGVGTMEILAYKFPSGTIPTQAANDILHYLPKGDKAEINFLMAAKQVSFKTDEITYCAKLIDEKYPGFDKLVEAGRAQESVKIQINRETIVDSLKELCAIDTFEGRYRVNWISNGKELVLSSRSENDEIKVRLPIKCEEHQTAFNAHMLQRILAAWVSDEITISIPKDAKTGGSIIVESHDSLAVVAPYRAD